MTCHLLSKKQQFVQLKFGWNFLNFLCNFLYSLSLLNWATWKLGPRWSKLGFEWKVLSFESKQIVTARAEVLERALYHQTQMMLSIILMPLLESAQNGSITEENYFYRNFKGPYLIHPSIKWPGATLLGTLYSAISSICFLCWFVLFCCLKN